MNLDDYGLRLVVTPLQLETCFWVTKLLGFNIERGSGTQRLYNWKPVFGSQNYLDLVWGGVQGLQKGVKEPRH